MGCRGLVFVVVMKTVGVGEMVSGFGENYGLVVSGLLCWRREGDDKVEREAGRRWGGNGEAGFWVSIFRVGGRGERRRRRERKSV